MSRWEFASSFARKMLELYRGRHFEVETTHDGCVVVEHNGKKGQEFAFVGAPLRLQLSQRDVVAARASGESLEHTLRAKANEIHTWADRRSAHERAFDALHWRLFSDYI